MLRLRSVYRVHPEQAAWLDRLAATFPKRGRWPDRGLAVSYVLARAFEDLGIGPASALPPIADGPDAEPQVFEEPEGETGTY